MRPVLSRRTTAPVSNNSPVPMSPRTSGPAFAYSDLFGAGDSYSLEHQLDALEGRALPAGPAAAYPSASASAQQVGPVDVPGEGALVVPGEGRRPLPQPVPISGARPTDLRRMLDRSR